LKQLTILFDETCAICRRCSAWMSTQEAFLPLEFMGSRTKLAKARYSGVPWLGEELVVVSDLGEVWVGPAAFITALWALKEWREWSYRLSGDLFVPLAERFFTAISHNRRWIAALIHDETRCKNGVCEVHPHQTPYR
jgi:predicted DCC family thiol-disulfide oxidoreductase YuxK